MFYYNLPHWPATCQLARVPHGKQIFSDGFDNTYKPKTKTISNLFIPKTITLA